MPVFVARTSEIILREIAARLVARGPLNDLTEGSILHTLAATFAEELANTEMRLHRIRDSFSLETVVGTDLDARVADFRNMPARLPATNATGGAVTLKRTDTAAALVVPGGSLFSRLDDQTKTYRTLANVTFPVGIAQISDIAVACTVPGSIGNCPPGTITILSSAPSDVIAVANTIAIVNGADQEQDNSLRSRAVKYLSSLAKTTPPAIEYAVESFVASDGSAAKFVRIFEDNTPGYSELLIDDGGGLLGYRRIGAPATGTVQAGGPPVFVHERPAVDPITSIQVVDSGGLTRFLTPDDYTSFPERGLIYVNEGVVVAGETWTVQKYDVFVGLPAEVQAIIEPAPGYSGLRASGSRVRVVAPTVQYVTLSLNVIPVAGADFEATVLSTRSAAVEYIASLGPGEVLYMSRLYDRLQDNPDVLAVRIYAGGIEPLELSGDIYPPTRKHVLRTENARITVVPVPEEI